MKRSTDRILTTHTGSLPLPPQVRQALAAKRRGETYDQAVIDAALTTAIGDQVKVMAWYDNEMGYSQRLFDLARFVASKL